MAMNAHADSFVSLITNAGRRFVVPVYQRPYSWDIEQCEQLWDDILFVGNSMQDRHFTGSVVWVQDGTMPASGIAPVLLIDGQQRTTTIILIIAALAHYALSNPDKALSFSYDDIVDLGYLINKRREGDERYKLSLSKGDKPTLESILENLINPNFKIIEESARIIENYNFFKERIAALEDPNIIWNGINRLDIVSISLDANQDNPQLIFESMNSTGKDLSSADLIRNYVLMGLPKQEQDELYLNHWRNIELTLGADSYESIFDEFLRNYLTVLYAPEPLVKRDVYSIFKRHVKANGYDKDGRIVELLNEIERFARYYSYIMAGKETNPQRAAILNEMRKLDMQVVNPFLLSLYDDYDQGVFGDSEFLELLELTESYLFRRSICEVGATSLNKFLPSVIARLNKVQEDGGNYVEAYKAFLKLEAGTIRRFPDNSEFFNTLISRDAYHYRRALYLLSNLENMHHPKDPMNLSSGAYSIEHVMPQNGQASEGWKDLVGNMSEEEYGALVNNLGNLTLTAYNSELSDEGFDKKKARYVGGYGKDYLVISDAMRNADKWGQDEIAARAKCLASDAEKRWKNLDIELEVAKQYEPKKKQSLTGRSAVFKKLFDAGFIAPGTILCPYNPENQHRAKVTETGLIELSNGETFKSPSLAAVRVNALRGGTGARNGWRYWRAGENGPVLDELRSKYLIENGESVTNDTKRFRIAFWDGFYEYCATLGISLFACHYVRVITGKSFNLV